MGKSALSAQVTVPTQGSFTKANLNMPATTSMLRMLSVSESAKRIRNILSLNEARCFSSNEGISLL